MNSTERDNLPKTEPKHLKQGGPKYSQYLKNGCDSSMGALLKISE